MYAVSVMWQHVLLSKGLRQDGVIMYIGGNVHCFNYVKNEISSFTVLLSVF